MRRQAGRSLVLVHHLRLDDVELAGPGLCRGCGDWMAARAALVATAKIAAGEQDPVYIAKLHTARYVADHFMLAAPMQAREVLIGGVSGLALEVATFRL